MQKNSFPLIWICRFQKYQNTKKVFAYQFTTVHSYFRLAKMISSYPLYRLWPLCSPNDWDRFEIGDPSLVFEDVIVPLKFCIIFNFFHSNYFRECHINDIIMQKTFTFCISYEFSVYRGRESCWNPNCVMCISKKSWANVLKLCKSLIHYDANDVTKFHFK